MRKHLPALHLTDRLTANHLPPPVPAREDQPLTVVHYHCNPNQSTSFIQDQRLGTEEPLQIWVESPCACPNACTMGDLGLGTIFLIILSLSAAAYFILGNALKPHTCGAGVFI